MKHKIYHNESKEFIVPYCAIENNIYFIADDNAKVEFEDGKTALIKERKEVHILNSSELIKTIYGNDHTPQTILNGWYSKYGDKLYSLWFWWCKCK